MYYIRIVLFIMMMLSMSALDSDGYFMFIVAGIITLLFIASCIPLLKERDK